MNKARQQYEKISRQAPPGSPLSWEQPMQVKDVILPPGYGVNKAPAIQIRPSVKTNFIGNQWQNQANQVQRPPPMQQQMQQQFQRPPPMQQQMQQQMQPNWQQQQQPAMHRNWQQQHQQQQQQQWYAPATSASRRDEKKRVVQYPEGSFIEKDAVQEPEPYSSGNQNSFALDSM